MRRYRRRGFTLIEVLVAVVLSGVVALLAHQLFGAAVDGGRRLRDARLALDRRANSDQFLRAVILSLETGIDSADGFSGQPERVRFSSWLPTADGWFERRSVVLELSGHRWVASAPPEAQVDLADSVKALRFDYMLEMGANTRWVSAWESAVSAPLAIRVRVDRNESVDTMIYLVKGRG